MLRRGLIFVVAFQLLAIRLYPVGLDAEVFESTKQFGSIRQTILEWGGEKGVYWISQAEYDLEGKKGRVSLYQIKNVFHLSDQSRIDALIEDHDPIVRYLFFDGKLLASVRSSPNWVLQTSPEIATRVLSGLKNILPSTSSFVEFKSAPILQDLKEAEKRKEIDQMITYAAEMKAILVPGVKQTFSFLFNGNPVEGTYDISSNGMLSTFAVWTKDTQELVFLLQNTPSKDIQIAIPPSFDIPGIESISSKLQPLTERAKIGLRVKTTTEGWIVMEVHDGYPAKEAGLQPGDLIISVGGKSASTITPEAFLIQYKDAKFTDITFKRQGEVRYVKLALGKKSK